MKKGTQYLKPDPWEVIEEGFHNTQDRVSESIFSIANEYLGVRGYFDEGYSGPTLRGAYVNGIYEYDHKPKPQYRGITGRTNFMLNCDDWLYTRIIVDGEQLDLHSAVVRDYRRSLDMRSGLLTRKFIWQLASGKTMKIIFARLLSNNNEHRAYQHIVLESSAPCMLSFQSGIDFNTTHGNYKESFWAEADKSQKSNMLGIVCQTTSTKQELGAAFRYSINTKDSMKVTNEIKDKYVGIRIRAQLSANTPFVFDKEIQHDKQIGGKCSLNASNMLAALGETPFEPLDMHIEHQKKYWQKKWCQYDIEIDGDVSNQQGIRYCIFQLLQTYRGLSAHDNIGAKGLTGEVYNGHCYWETETIVFPFYLFTNISAAKQLLDYRYRTLPQAKERAKMIDCEGASYPLATLNGEEGNDYWQHANTQLQPSTAVAYAIWHYTKISNDETFLNTKGLEMLVEISRFLLSRGNYGQVSGGFGFYGVMGPDEFQMMVNHDAYTNLMGRFTFNYTISSLRNLKVNDSVAYEHLIQLLHLQDNEIKGWQRAADHMVIYKRDDGVIEQQQGFFDLPHIDVSKITQDQYPLYDHWSYDRLFRNDMIKQPDVLMYQFLFGTQFSPESKLANYDYYNPRTVHESSLSPSIHSILAEELGKEDDALKFFAFATRLDLDNYNNNTAAGLHVTSIAAAWLNIIYGFGGLRSDDIQLKLAPKCPQFWKGYSFKINYRGALISVHVNSEQVVLSMTSVPTITLSIYGDTVTLNKDQSYVIKTREATDYA